MNYAMNYGAYKKETYKLHCEVCGKAEEVDIWLCHPLQEGSFSDESPKDFYGISAFVQQDIRYETTGRKSFEWLHLGERALVCSETCKGIWKLRRVIDGEKTVTLEAMWKTLSDVIKKIKERDNADSGS